MYVQYMYMYADIASHLNQINCELVCWETKLNMGVFKTRNGEMTKWRNGARDKSQGCKITVPLKLKLLFHWNLHLFESVAEYSQ